MSHKPQPLDLEAVQATVAPILRVHGVELVDLEWTTTPSGRTLRVTIERPGSTDAGGGVSLDTCADVSRDLSSTLDTDDPIDGAYNLEVSSPGLDRPLHKHQDYVRFSGKTAKLKLNRPEPDGQRVLRGVIHAEDGGDTIHCDVDGRVHTIPLAAVAAAHLVFEWGPAPKPTGRKKAGPPSAKKASAKKASAKKPSAKRSAGSSGSPGQTGSGHPGAGHPGSGQNGGETGGGHRASADGPGVEDCSGTPPLGRAVADRTMERRRGGDRVRQAPFGSRRSTTGSSGGMREGAEGDQAPCVRRS